MKTLATADVGNHGSPGSQASEITCSIAYVRQGRLQAEGRFSVGCNQGSYQENYVYGPWRGRSDTISGAIKKMLEVVPDEYREDIRRAAQEAQYDAEDAIVPD